MKCIWKSGLHTMTAGVNINKLSHTKDTLTITRPPIAAQ